MRSFTIAACLILSGCVSGECIEDCYLIELRKADERLSFKCESTRFHPHCENY
jgi:hypothetical protein